jgi:hypothetical protein
MAGECIYGLRVNLMKVNISMIRRMVSEVIVGRMVSVILVIGKIISVTERGLLNMRMELRGRVDGKMINGLVGQMILY